MSTLEHAMGRTGAQRILAVVGGLPLSKAGKRRLAFTVERLRRPGSLALYLCHCTGQEACEGPPHVAQILCAGDAVCLP